MKKAAINFSEYVCGGYYITRSVDKPAYMSNLLPDKLFGFACVSTFIPDLWTLSWTSVPKADRIKNASFFELSSSQLQELIKWCDASFEKLIEWPGMCLTLDTAAFIVKKILSHLSDVIIFGIGLHKNDVPAFVTATESTPEGVNSSGLYKLLSKDTRLNENGTVLGFDLLEVEYGMIGCSWLCNNLVQPVYDKFSIRPNQHGFIENFEAAHKCTDFFRSGDVGAEPGLWLPWLIMQYKI